MSPRSSGARNINIKRQFIHEQLRVSTLAQQYSMNEPAVRRVIERHVGPAFDGCPQTTVPVLWRLQKAYAERYGNEQAIELLEYFNLLNGRSAEAYVLQEAGISSGLYNALVNANRSRGLGLREMVEMDPRAAQLAVQRLEEEENYALEAQARRIRKYLDSVVQMADPIQHALTSVVRAGITKEKPRERGSLVRASSTREREATLNKTSLKTLTEPSRIPWGKNSDALLVIGLIALMAWLLMTIA